MDGEILTRGGEEIAQTLSLAIAHPVDGVVEHVLSIEDPHMRSRCALLASACWHEQRHFLDFLLTNHGTARFRQFASIYVNAPAILRAARDQGSPLFCPLTAYADPVLAAAHGLTDPTGVLAAQGKDVRGRSRMLREDARLVASGDVSFRLGGDALLEALAHMSQLHAIQLHFGLDVAREIQRDPALGAAPAIKYGWLIDLADARGLLSSARDGGTVVYENVTILFAIAMAALAVRRYGQDAIDGVAPPAASPGGRLGTIMRECEKQDVHGIAGGEAWDLVNRISRDAWGRTVVEELRADFEHEGELCDRVAERGPHPIDVALADFHRLRGGLIDDLERDPSPFVDPTAFVTQLLPSLRPMPIVASPSGRLGPTPPDWKLVAGYRLNEDVRWWWAARPPDQPQAPDAVALSEHQAWDQIAEWWAPLAKMMVNGRRHRLMLGPELVTAEARHEQSGNPLRFDPRYAYPDEDTYLMDSDVFFDLTLLSEAQCDMCTASIHPGAGKLVSPWLFRRYPEARRQAVERAGGGTAGEMLMLRDWSVWVICDPCVAKLPRGAKPPPPADRSPTTR